MGDKLILSKEERKDCLVVKMEGEFVFDEVPKFENFVTTHKGKNNNIAIDLKKVVFLDSSGMGSLVKMLNYMKQKSGGFYLINVSNDILKIFEIADLITFFKVLSESEFKSLFRANLDDIMKKL